MKCLRKVVINGMNPVPVLQSVGSHVKLQEVTVTCPKHCEVRRYEMCMQKDVDCVFTQCASCYCGTGLLRVLDRRQVSQLVVTTPVTVLSCTCSPPQRTGPKCPPVWPLHNISGKWFYGWMIMTSASCGPFYPVSATASLFRNW